MLETVAEATPPESETVPRLVVPSLKLTVPVGVPPLLAVTVAFNVTFAPMTTLVGVIVSAVAVASLIATVTVFDVEALSFVSPAYVAVIGYEPFGYALLEAVTDSTPLLLRLPDLRTVEPDLSVTLPVGTPLPEFFFTVSVE